MIKLTSKGNIVTLNQRAQGSNPCRPTRNENSL